MADDADKMLYTGFKLSDLPRLPARQDDDPSPLITTLFYLEGDQLDPKLCTEALGVEPTAFDSSSALRPGVWVPSGRPNIRLPYWKLKLTKEKSYNIDEPLKRLLDMIWPRREAVIELIRETGYEASFTTTVTIYVDPPRYSLSGNILERLGFFGFDYGLDIYDYSSYYERNPSALEPDRQSSEPK
jgi:hypothetical protein